MNGLWGELIGKPKASPSAGTSGSPAPGGSPGLYGESAAKSRTNAELLQEVFRIVFLKEPRDPREFGSFVDSMNQGASIEGIYNGFTHSKIYRELEEENKGAAPAAIRVFSEELAQLELELPEPTNFDAKSAAPQEKIEFPSGEGQGGDPKEVPSEIRFGGSQKPEMAANTPAAARSGKPDFKALSEEYARNFVGSSVFTLKRVLGDEALKVIAAKKDKPQELVAWYGAWVVRLAARGVSFGLELRNNADAEFHRRWASTANPDKLTWEVLNRLHRLVNEAHRPNQQPAFGAPAGEGK